MQGNRDFLIRKKPNLILNKSFSVYGGLNVGDTGSMMLTGTIEGEIAELQQDGTELLIKDIKIVKAENIETKKKIRDL